MIDTFTKWIEVEPVVKTTTEAAKRFLTKNVSTRFGILSRIIIDNGAQFSSGHFQEFCEDLGIKIHFASVLWVVRTTTSRATGETPFFLVYGAEAMLPPELKIGSARTDCFNDNDQNERRLDDINFLEERRNQALIRSAIYQQAMRRYHSRIKA